MASMLRHALDLAAAGFHVFPLEDGTKVPAIDGFPARATRDEAQIRAWWTCPLTGAELTRNVGISTSRFGADSALLVVDIDVKDGRDGETIAGTLDLPPTWETRTPSGGRHLIYVVDAPVPQGANVFGPGVDIRSRGGFIVGPGSKTSKGEYVWVSPLPTEHNPLPPRNGS